MYRGMELKKRKHKNLKSKNKRFHLLHPSIFFFFISLPISSSSLCYYPQSKTEIKIQIPFFYLSCSILETDQILLLCTFLDSTRCLRLSSALSLDSSSSSVVLRFGSCSVSFLMLDSVLYGESLLIHVLLLYLYRYVSVVIGFVNGGGGRARE